MQEAVEVADEVDEGGDEVGVDEAEGSEAVGLVDSYVGSLAESIVGGNQKTSQAPSCTR